MEVHSHSVIGETGTHVGGSSADAPTQVKRVFAKPRPKVRSRDKIGSGKPVEDQGAVILAQQGKTPAGPHTDLSPPVNNPDLAQMQSLATEAADAQDNADQATTAERKPLAVAQSAVDTAADETPAEAPPCGETVAEAGPGTATADSSSSDDDDYELARLRRRGDLPIKVSAITGLPSGVASLRRDKITGRVRVLRPSGFHLAHSGTTIAVDDSSAIFLDELSGFERRSGAPQSYMRGWLGSRLALMSLRSYPTHHHAVAESLHLEPTIVLAPSTRLHSHQTRAVVPSSALGTSHPLPCRSLHAPRRRELLYLVAS